MMPKYVALIRGIGPTNPNMRNEKLCRVLVGLGFTNVQAVVSSGNVLFDAKSTSERKLAAGIEQAWPKQLGFKATTIVRRHESLQRLIDRNPFKGLSDSSKSHLNVTFLKAAPRGKMKFPIRPEKKAFQLLGLYDGAVCSVIDTSKTKTPELMSFLERQFGREITTRTWKTVHRILKKLKGQ